MDRAVVVELAFFSELHRARAFTRFDLSSVEGLTVVFRSRGVIREGFVGPNDRTADGDLHTLRIVADALHLDSGWFCVRLLGPIILLRSPGNRHGKDEREGDRQLPSWVHDGLRYGHSRRHGALRSTLCT